MVYCSDKTFWYMYKHVKWVENNLMEGRQNVVLDDYSSLFNSTSHSTKRKPQNDSCLHLDGNQIKVV